MTFSLLSKEMWHLDRKGRRFGFNYIYRNAVRTGEQGESFELFKRDTRI